MISSLYSQRDAILEVIDAHEWKHSWHLPKHSNGAIDWFCVETHKKVKDLLEKEKEYAITLLTKSQHLLRSLTFDLED